MAIKKARQHISKEEMDQISHNEDFITRVLGNIEQSKTFNLGDFLVAYEPANDYYPRKLIVNSFGVPRKYKVIHKDSYGTPYLREINRDGEPAGRLVVPLKMYSRPEYEQNIEYEVCPDFADALIFNDEDSYKASELHKQRAELHSEIVAHNKKVRINTSSWNDDNSHKPLITFLQTLTTGSVVWRTPTTFFTILTINPIIPTTYKGKRLAQFGSFGTATTHKGIEFNLTAEQFLDKTIYSAQPRSFNEVKDPK